MVSVSSPSIQALPVACEDVKTTDPPSQNVVAPLAVIVGAAGNAFTVTVVAADAAEEHPLASV